MRRNALVVLVGSGCVVLVACAGAGAGAGGGPAPYPASVEARDIARCNGDWSDDGYSRSEASACELVALGYEREGRTHEALATRSRGCSLASESRDERVCSGLASMLSGLGAGMPPADVARHRALVASAVNRGMPSLRLLAADLYARLEPKDLATARALYTHECRRTGDDSTCRQAEALGEKFNAEQRAQQDKMRGMHAEVQRQSAQSERDRMAWEDQKWAIQNSGPQSVQWQPEGESGSTGSSSSRPMPNEPPPPASTGEAQRPAAPSSSASSAPAVKPAPSTTSKPPVPPATPTKPTASAAAPPSPPTPSTTQPAQPPPAPPLPQRVTWQTTGTSDYWFADDGTCCQKLFALQSLAENAITRACAQSNARAKLETVRWSSAAYCSSEACGPGCGHAFRCRALAEGSCER